MASLVNHNKVKIKDPETGRVFVRDYFTYTASVASLAAGASATDQVSINADSDFVWEKTSYFATLASAAQTDSSRVIPLVNVSITDGGSGRNLQDDPTPLPAIAGNGGLPLNLSVPRVFDANATVSVTFSNFDAAATYTDLYMVFHGYKRIYY